MADISNLGSIVNYNPQAVQGWSSTILYIFIGILILGLVGWLLWKAYNYASYPYVVHVFQKVGNSHYLKSDRAKISKYGSYYWIHYLGLNKFSPVFSNMEHATKYGKEEALLYDEKTDNLKFGRTNEITDILFLTQVKEFGFMAKLKKAFCVELVGDSIFPIRLSENRELKPIDIDLFNYLQTRIKYNHERFPDKWAAFWRLAPVLGAGLIAVMFFVGMIFYSKHIETINAQWLASTKDTITKIFDNALQCGGGQFIQ